MKKWLLLVVLASAVSVIGFWRTHLPATVPGSVPPSGSASPLVPSVESEEFQGIGYVEPASEVRKLMLRTGGVIKSCQVEVGDTIRKGCLLMELENATQKADVELARKNLAMLTAEAVHVNAGVNPYRLKVLERCIERLREKVRYSVGEVAR